MRSEAVRGAGGAGGVLLMLLELGGVLNLTVRGLMKILCWTVLMNFSRTKSMLRVEK
jgi:hypothetical protein